LTHEPSARAAGGPPEPPTEATRLRMRRQRRADTAPELALRRKLWSMGLRYRLQRPVEGQRRLKIDIAFVASRVAVFVDGCFWHSCPEHASVPRSNTEWWITKLARNSERDVETRIRLEEQGWRVIRVWEHDVTRSLDKVAASIAAAVRRRGAN